MEARKREGVKEDYVFETELYVDGKKVESAKLPTAFRTSHFNLFWKYELSDGPHEVQVKILNPSPQHYVQVSNLVVFGKSKV